MPRGRQKKNPIEGTTPEELNRQAQTPPTGTEFEGSGQEQGVIDGGAQETDPKEQAPNEQAPAAKPEQAASAVEQTVSDETHQETVSAPAGPELNEEPVTLAGYMAENVRLDIREFMRDFGINGHPPESVYDSIMGIADRFRGEQAISDAPADQQEQVPAPDQQQAENPAEAPVPLNVRINSLVLDGDTRALATAEYGDLTISRIRVKQDSYGTLSVNMPKYRDAGGWKETCRFDSVESRNRLTGEVLDAYQNQLAQLQGQGPGAAEAPAAGDNPAPEEAQAPEQGAAPEDSPEMGEPEQGGFGMSMGQW